MSATPRQWKYLERRPGSSYQQLSIKGKRIWAWTLYCEFMNAKEPRTPEQLALDWAVPLVGHYPRASVRSSSPKRVSSRSPRERERHERAVTLRASEGAWARSRSGE